MPQSVIERPPPPDREDPHRSQRERCRSTIIGGSGARLTPLKAKQELAFAKERASNAATVRQDRRSAQVNAAEDRAADRRFKKWLRELHRKDGRRWVRVRTPKSQRIPMARQKEKRDNRNTRSLPAYRRPIIDKLGRQGIFLDFKYDGASRNPFGVFRRRTEYPFKSESVQRDSFGRPVFVSNMGRTPEEICEAADSAEGIMRAERANAKLCVNAILQLPFDATLEQQLEITRRYCSDVFDPHDIPYVAVLHKPDPDGDQRNYHVHITFAFRQMVRIGDHKWAIGVNLRTDLDTDDQFFEFRRAAAEIMTIVMRKAGHNRTYTHLSNADRGLAIIPQKPLNMAQVSQVRRGSHVGSNEFNAREIAKAEQVLERPVSRYIPLVNAKPTPVQVLPINLSRRVLLTTILSTVDRGERPISALSMTRFLSTECVPSGHSVDVPLIKPRPLPVIISLPVRSTLGVVRPVFDVPPQRDFLSPVVAVPKRTRAPFVSLQVTSMTAMPIVTVRSVAPRLSLAALEIRPSDCVALELGRGSLPPMPLAVGRPVKQPRDNLLALPARRPRFGFAIKVTRPAVARLPLLASLPPYAQQSPARPNAVPLAIIQPVRIGAVRGDQGLPRVVARISTQMVAPSRGNRIWPLVVQPASRRCPSVISPRPSPRVATLPTPATAPVLAAPIAPAWPARAIAMLRGRISSPSRPLLPMRTDPTRTSLVDLGKPIQVTQLDARWRHRLQLPPISSLIPSAVTSLQIMGLGVRIANTEVKPIVVARVIRPSKISSALGLFSATNQSTPFNPLAQSLHQLAVTPARSASTIEGVRSSETPSALRPPMRDKASARFTSEFNRICSQRDQLEDRVAAITRQDQVVPAIVIRLSPVKENGTSTPIDGTGPVVDGEELMRRIRGDRIYLIEERGVVLPHDRAALSRAEFEWLRVHQMDALGVQRDQQLEIARIVAHVDQHIDAFRNQTLRVDENFAAAWNSFAAAPAVQEVANKAAAGDNAQAQSEAAVGNPTVSEQGHRPAPEAQEGQLEDSTSDRTIDTRSTSTSVAHVHAAAVADPGRG